MSETPLGKGELLGLNPFISSQDAANKPSTVPFGEGRESAMVYLQREHYSVTG
jgi:hypothetical protein